MAQLSRPYQIALGAMAVLALVWFAALHRPGAGSSASSSSSGSAPVTHAAPAPTPNRHAAAEARSAAKATPVYHGPAPGVEGLTRDIAKAHGAVALSQRKAAEAEHTGESHPKTAAPAHTAAPARTSTSPAPAHKSSTSTATRPPQQVQLERELTHGKTVLLVFWNPRASVDREVRDQALAFAGASKGGVDVHVARANQVGLFGPATEVAHVYQTPTVLIVAKRGLVSTLTGLVDLYGLRQAVREAEHPGK